MKKYRLVYDPTYIHSWYYERRYLLFFWDFMGYTMADNEAEARKNFADGPAGAKTYRVVEYT